uniref:Uncharacterized protein n=1 Tax=Ciona savignyi TaxID=51511 RepID=H2YNB6_CIOSA
MYTWKRWTKPGRVKAGPAVDQTIIPPTQGNPLFTGKSGKEFIFKENRPNKDGDMREMNMDYLLARVQNVHIADEARNEAETLINDWLNEKIITELTGDENQDENLPVVSANLPQNAAPIKPTSWYNDSDTFLQEYLV